MRPPAAKPRVLILAEECNPDFVSVPLVGWSHYLALSKVAHTHLVTQIRNKKAIEQFGLVHGRDFTAIDSEAIARPAYLLRPYLGAANGKGWTAITALLSLTYPYFEHLVWQQFAPALHARQFDLVHRLTPLSPTTPSPIAAQCKRLGIPFLLGPLNGGLPWPRAFDRERRKESEWLSYLRGVYKLLPHHHATWRNASAVLIGSASTFSQVPRQHRAKCYYLPENAIDPTRFTATRPVGRTLPSDGDHSSVGRTLLSDRGDGTPPPRRPLRITFVGRLVPYKGPDMLLEAAAPFIRAGQVTVDLVGDGPLRPDLQRLIEREQLSHGVTLSGWVNHHEVQTKLASADLLGFPSIREFGGGVVLEAMALGVPPLVVDYGGPAELVTDSTGFKVKLGTRHEIITQLRRVLTEIVTLPSSLDERSGPAFRRAREQFTWDIKAQQVLSLYRHLLGQTLARPDFPMPLPDLPAPVAHPLQPHPYIELKALGV